MNKLLFGIILLGISIILGYFLSRKYVYKEKFYNDFLAFNNLIKNEILFSKNSLESLINNNLEKNEIVNLLKEYMDNKKILKPYFLTEDEFIMVCEYLKYVGTSDAVSQIEYLKVVECRILEEVKTAHQQRVKLCPAYIKLSVLIGITCFILVI